MTWQKGNADRERQEVEALRTKSGKVVSDEDIERWAAEAERGYCVELDDEGTMKSRHDENEPTRCGRPLPCPKHG